MIRWSLHLKGPKRTRHAAVTVGHKVYSFGGYGDGENSIYDMGQIGVHVFNTVSLRWMKLPPVTTGREHPLEVPSRRWGHTAVLIDDIIYIWGGEYCNVLYAFDVNTHKWFKPKISGTVPGARWGHSACVLGKVMYILGGFNELTGCTNDIYKLDTTTMVWSLINTTGTPQALACHSATIIGTRMFVFACQGDQPGPDYNSIRVFDTETNCWLSTPSAQLLPEGRWCHSAFAYNGELYIFGGHNFLLDRFFNDLWKLNPKTFSWKKVEPKGKGPCPLMSRMCCCMMGDRIIIFGGYRFALQPVSRNVEDLNEDDAELSDLYILDFSPSLKTLCKLAVIQHGLEQLGLPHDIRWELEAMTTNNSSKHDEKKKDDSGREQVPGNGTENVRQGDVSLHSEGIERRAQECAHAVIPTRNYK